MARLLVVLLCLLCSTGTRLEGLDLGLDTSLALCQSETLGLVLEALCLPVLGLLCGLEDRVFPDRGVRVGVDLLDVLRANLIGEVGCELLLEANSKRIQSHNMSVVG